MNQTQIIEELNHFYGTEHYYKIPFSKVVYTDGIEGFIRLCKCWWLISDLGIQYSARTDIHKSFLIVRIKVNEDKSCIIDLREDSDLEPIFTKDYDYTDFPLKEYEFYLIDNVFLLKGEY